MKQATILTGDYKLDKKALAEIEGLTKWIRARVKYHKNNKALKPYL